MMANKHIEPKRRIKNSKKPGLKTNSVNLEFPIVGIGASAGGLEALISFLGSVPDQTGMTFIIVQHRERDGEDLLVELLQHATTMEVTQAKENLLIQPNCVYVAPPDRYLAIRHRVLHLTEYLTPHSQMPIDFFFQSLADDLQERSIGVILSGMGTDGTLGLRAIKEKGGLVFVQKPSTASFDSMPRSAIDLGLADVICPAESLPFVIISTIESTPLIGKPQSQQADLTKSSYSEILLLLKSQTGHDYSAYKRNSVYRRIERRMGVHQFDEIDRYLEYLKETPQEVELLFKELLIGVTSFFREPAEWEVLKTKAIPQLLNDWVPAQTIRVWVSACSTGEEAYSFAIVFNEVLKQLEPSKEFSIQIFATDLDRDAIDKAREGIYPATIAGDMTAERLKMNFMKVDRGYQVIKPIREMIIFAQQNMIKDPPFTKIDILSCRNVLIYLTPEVQKRLIPLFHYSLNPEGYLFLGNAETVGSYTDLFKALDSRSRIYKREKASWQREPVEFPTSNTPGQYATKQPARPDRGLQIEADRLILQTYAPPTVLVNERGDILYISGRTGKYLEPAAGKVNWNIFAMAREGLNYKLSSTFHKALRRNETVTYRNATVINEGGEQLVTIMVNPLQEPEVLRGLILIVFHDLGSAAVVGEHVAEVDSNSQRELELEYELMQARQRWQSIGMEMQIAQEELKSRNEEMQSSNEELQSTNEELTTTKEEIEFLNDELKVMNSELQSKLKDLYQVNNDLKNLLDSTNIAILFLNNALCVKRFSNQMSVISKLIISDVGRPITDIASELFYPGLKEDVNNVLQSLNTFEKKLQTESGLWFNARILPYRTLDNKIDGVVITFIDITDSKQLEAELRAVKLVLEQPI